nr:peroxidase family protein [Micromonospora sp. DSM 115978]
MAALLVPALVVPAAPAAAQLPFEVQSLDGSGNNLANDAWGRVGTNYARVAPARYADGRSAPVAGPNSRYVSNRVFDDLNQNLFSERNVTQWGFAWGQFIDHTFGLRDERGTAQNIPFSATDPLESFTNTLGVVPFVRSAAAPGTGVTNPREQANTVSSYIDAWAVYGGTNDRLEWMREGPVDGNLSNNSARLLLPGGYLPRRDARGDAATAPAMDAGGRLTGQPQRAVVAGDVRANENIALQATQNLFAREHNRIVALLPNTLSEEAKFQIARRVVIAEQQYITYTEFLPALGVTLAPYTGYRPAVNASLSNEFAVVGYRAHSMIHGEVEIETDVGRYTPAALAALEAQGVEMAVEGDDIELAVPLNVGFFNPELVNQLQLGPLLQGIGLEAQYSNDEQIDNQLRSVLFQIPVPGNPECLDGPELPACFRTVTDLGAIDIERGRDHGMPSYNQLRQAYGLAPRTSFAAVTGESTEAFPADPELTPGNEVNDPDSMDFTTLFDVTGDVVPLDSEEADGDAVRATRRTPLAARLRAVYGSVSNLDAFTGMVAEPHRPGTDMGELQLAIWKRQFEELRDGDRFFYLNDPGLSLIRSQYGIDFRRTLAQVIAANTDIPASELAANVFLFRGEQQPTSCRVTYTVTTQWPGGFQAGIRLTNTGTAPIGPWTLKWSFVNGQTVSDLWGGTASQNGGKLAVTDASWNASIPANGGAVGGIGFNASWDNATNARPTNFTLNTTRCTVG